LKKLLAASLLTIFLFTSSVVADDKCIHVSKNMQEVISFTNVFIGDSPFECSTEHFHYALCFANKNTIVFSKHTRVMFIGVGDRTAYYIYRPREDSDFEIYMVDVEDTSSPITQLFYVMQREFIDLMKKGHKGYKRKRV